MNPLIFPATATRRIDGPLATWRRVNRCGLTLLGRFGLGPGGDFRLSIRRWAINASCGGTIPFGAKGNDSNECALWYRGIGPSAVAHMCQKRILVVEDEALIRAMISEALRDEGFEVLETASGEDALAVVEGDPALHLVFTDVRLQGQLDGIALVSRLRETYPDLKLAVTSAYPPNWPAPRLVEVFVGKPYDVPRTVSRLKALLGGMAESSDQPPAIVRPAVDQAPSLATTDRPIDADLPDAPTKQNTSGSVQVVTQPCNDAIAALNQ